LGAIVARKVLRAGRDIRQSPIRLRLRYPCALRDARRRQQSIIQPIEDGPTRIAVPALHSSFVARRKNHQLRMQRRPYGPVCQPGGQL
jgi:hypothetical protein